jgi:hypothetical protein
MRILEHFTQQKIRAFLVALQNLCDEHEVSLVWALNCIRVVSNNNMEIVAPASRIQLARFHAVKNKVGYLSFEGEINEKIDGK